jgi:hypothetical protein
MRWLQAVLLLIGLPVLAAVVCGFGLAVFGAVVLFRPDPGTHGTGAWGSAFGPMLFLVLGAIGGGLGGAVGAMIHISRAEGTTWPRSTWLGIAVGFVLCALGQFVARQMESSGLWHDLFVGSGWGALVSFIVLGSLGGFLGSAIALAVPKRSVSRQ